MLRKSILALFAFFHSFNCSQQKSISAEVLPRSEFSLTNVYYSGKDGNGYETPNESSAVVKRFSKGERIRILETLSDPRRNLYGWVYVQSESGTNSWIKQNSIKAKLIPNEGIGEIYSITRVNEQSLESDKKLAGENLGLNLDLFIRNGEIISFGAWEKRKYKQYSVGSKEDMKYLSKSKNQVFELGKVRRFDQEFDNHEGCWFGFRYNAKTNLESSEISSTEDLAYRGNIRPKFVRGELKYNIKNKEYIRILNNLAGELLDHSPKEMRGMIPQLKCEGDHCHTAAWSLPERKYIFATLEGRQEKTGKFYSLFLIVSIEGGKEKVVSYRFENGSETVGRFFLKLTDMDANGIVEVWVSDQDSQAESYLERIYLLDGDLFLYLGERYSTGC